MPFIEFRHFGRVAAASSGFDVAADVVHIVPNESVVDLRFGGEKFPGSRVVAHWYETIPIGARQNGRAACQPHG